MWQPGWEGGFVENGYKSVCGCVPSLFTWNCHTTLLIGYTPVQKEKYDIWGKNKSGNKKKLVRKTDWTTYLRSVHLTVWVYLNFRLFFQSYCVNSFYFPNIFISCFGVFSSTKKVQVTKSFSCIKSVAHCCCFGPYFLRMNIFSVVYSYQLFLPSSFSHTSWTEQDCFMS